MVDTATRARRGSVGLAMTAAVAVIASFVAGKAALAAILLANFDVTTLPLFVGIAAVASIPLVLISGRLMVQFGPGRLVTALNAISAAMLIAEWIILGREPKLAAVAIFFHLSTLGAVLVSGFWSIINEQFDVRTAKRHIGRIGMAATLGGIVGGLVAGGAAIYLEPNAILLVLAGLQTGCAVVLHRLGGGRPRPPADDDDDELHGWSALTHVARSSLLRNLAFLIVLGAIAAAALDYVFKAEVIAAVGDDGSLRLFGLFYTVTSVFTALVQVIGARPVVERFGVARSVVVLPVTVTVVGAAWFTAPGLIATVIARGGEMVTRNSIYRAAYELLYAPLLEQRKRSTKVVLDVGAERIGDLLGAGLVGALIYLAPGHDALVLGAIIAGVAAVGFAVRLPRSYTAELEHSLRTRAGLERPAGPHRGMPTLTEAGDLTAMSLVNMQAFDVSDTGESDAEPTAAEPDAVPAHRLVYLAAGLCSDQPGRILRTLATPIPPELAALIVPLIGQDEVARAAILAMRTIAPRATGVLADALLDPTQALAVRRRVPSLLESAEPELARWALWKGLADPEFEVRYRCGRVLSKLEVAGRGGRSPEAVFAAVRREIEVDVEVWRSYSLATDDDDDADADATSDDDEDRVLHELMRRSSRGLEHIFTLLGLALPPDPLRIALQALYTEDRALRGTALEYLESVLPDEIRVALWPLLESTAVAPAPRAAAARPPEEIITGLRMSQPMILADLRRVRDEMRSSVEAPADGRKAAPRDRAPYDAAIRGHKPTLRALFEAATGSTAERAGRYVLRLTIGTSGAVVRAEVTSHPGGGAVAGFVSALIAEARGWQFPRAAEEVVISYPFVFGATK